MSYVLLESAHDLLRISGFLVGTSTDFQTKMSIELDLDFLTLEERQTILAVLKRDEELRQAEQARKR